MIGGWCSLLRRRGCVYKEAGANMDKNWGIVVLMTRGWLVDEHCLLCQSGGFHRFILAEPVHVLNILAPILVKKISVTGYVSPSWNGFSQWLCPCPCAACIVVIIMVVWSFLFEGCKLQTCCIEGYTLSTSYKKNAIFFVNMFWLVNVIYSDILWSLYLIIMWTGSNARAWS